METKTLNKCLVEKKSKEYLPKLFDCTNKGYCPDKLPFGNAFFCKQSPLFDKPKEEPKKELEPAPLTC